MNVYLKQYQKNQVETASPERILILLYDGAINFLNKAKIAMEQNNVEEIHNNIVKCENIILEFMGTLDMKEGKDLARNLYNLYEYLYNTLVSANMEKNIKKVEEVLGHLMGLRETWQKAIMIANAEKPKEELKPQKSGKCYDDDDDYYGDDDDLDDEDEDEDDE